MSKIMITAACIMLSGSAFAAVTNASFDWEDFTGFWWSNGYNYAESDNGVTMTAVDRAAAHENGFAFKAGYAADATDGSFSMADGDGGTQFIVTSIDIMGDIGNANVVLSGDLLVKGVLAGDEKWTIDPVESNLFFTYTAATTGDISEPIDRIVWSAPYDPAETNLVWNNKIDNLDITTYEAPPVSGLITFDWNDNPAQWDGFPVLNTNSGYIAATSGRIFANGGGVIIQTPSIGAAYGDQPQVGTITINDGVEDVSFQVHSVDLSLSGTATTNATLVGTLDGSHVFTLTYPAQALTTMTKDDLAADLSTYIVDSLTWTTDSGTGWGQAMDNLAVEIYIAPEEIVYDWHLDTFWNPHSIGPWGGPLGYHGDPLYLWSGTNYVMGRIMHRPGLEDFPPGGGQYEPSWPEGTNDVAVGGYGWRGVYVNDPVRVLETNETLQVTFNTVLYISGDDDRLMDVFFSPNAGNGTFNYFGSGLGADTWADELGFLIWRQSATNDIAIVMDPSDPNMGVIPAPLRIPLADLGMATTNNGDHTDPLSVSYTAEKSTVADEWICNLTISNLVSEDDWSTGDLLITNSTAYDNQQYFVLVTADDLSNGNITNGLGGLGGYEIDDLYVKILLNLEALYGYEAYLNSYGFEAGDLDTGAYEDYDSDDLLNIYEYGWGGDMTNGTMAPATLPTMWITNGVSYYSSVQLKDPNSGITYSMQAADDLYLGFSTPAWDEASPPQSVDADFNRYTGGINLTGAQFFQTVITTNAP